MFPSQKPKPKRPPKHTPENNWLLTDEQVEKIVHGYVELRKTQQETARYADASVHVVAVVLKHKKLTRSPWDRPKHPWSKAVGAAVAERESRGG